MPYAPGIQSEGGRYLFEGMRQGGNNLTRALLGYFGQKAENDELNAMLGGGMEQPTSKPPKGTTFSADGTAHMPGSKPAGFQAEETAKAMSKAAKGYGDILSNGYGIDKNVLDTMSIGEKRGMLRRMELQSALQERAQAAEFRDLQMEGLRRQRSIEDSMTSFGRDYAEAPPGMEQQQAYYDSTMTEMPSMPGADPFSRMTYALGRNPQAMASPQFDNVVTSLQRFDQAPMALRRLGIEEGQLRVNEENVRLQGERLNKQKETKGTKPRVVKVSYKDDVTGETYSFDMTREEFEERKKAQSPDLKSKTPKAGDVVDGYRYNGKYPPGDKRAWEKVK